MDSNENRVRIETIAAKILAIGELIKFRGGEPSLEDERVNFGIGEILTDLASDILLSIERSSD